MASSAASERSYHSPEGCLYYHAGCSREKAQNLLLEKKVDGAFLIKDSERSKGSLTLCLMSNGKVYYYRILNDNSGKIYLQHSDAASRSTVKRHDGLTELVEYYKSLGCSGGLAAPLAFGVHSDGSASSDDDSDNEDLEQSAPKIIKQHVDEQADRPPIPPKSVPCETMVLSKLRTRFQRSQGSVTDEDFGMRLQHYMENHLKSDITARNKSQGLELTHLKNLLNQEAEVVTKFLEEYFNKLELVRRTFHGSSYQNKLPSLDQMKNGVAEAQSLCYGDCTCSVDSLLEEQHDRPASHQFVDSVAKQVRFHVDLRRGKLVIIKQSGKKNHSLHDVTAVLKAVVDKPMLDIVTPNKELEPYHFNSITERAHFCQLAQAALREPTDHNSKIKSPALSIYCGTWNMGNSANGPQLHLQNWLKCQGEGKTVANPLKSSMHDIYAIGCQETKSCEQDWQKWVTEQLSNCSFSTEEELETIKVMSSWKIRLIIFARKSIRGRITNIQSGLVATGIANTIRNKGAVAISFHVDDTPLCFISSHLAANRERLERRNQNSKDIMKNLASSLSNREVYGDVETLDQFHHVFWMGDLNYRVDVEDHTINEAIGKIIEDPNPYLKVDQLFRVIQQAKAFYGYEEELITFPPTYRYYKNSETSFNYIKPKRGYTKYNSPSWCDRIIWKSYPGLPIANMAYGLTPTVTGSDHKPVFASFVVGIPPKVTEPQKRGVITLKLEEIKCQFTKYSSGDQSMDNRLTAVAPGIGKKTVDLYEKKLGNEGQSSDLKLRCGIFEIKSEVDAMLNPLQHLILSVKSTNESELMGGCVIPISTLLTNMGECYIFECDLVNLGEKSGTISGCLEAVVVGPMPAAPDDHYKSLFVTDEQQAQFWKEEFDTNSTPVVSQETGIPHITIKPHIKLKKHVMTGVTSPQIVGDFIPPRVPKFRMNHAYETIDPDPAGVLDPDPQVKGKPVPSPRKGLLQ